MDRKRIRMNLPGQKFGYSPSSYLRGKRKKIFKSMINILRMDGNWNEAIEMVQEQRARNSADRRMENFVEWQHFERFDIMDFEE